MRKMTHAPILCAAAIRTAARRTIVPALLLCACTFAAGKCGGGDGAYWTFTLCAENPADGELKPEVAAELAQYGVEFSACLTGMADMALSGNTLLLREFRSRCAVPAVPFSADGVAIKTEAVPGDGEKLLLRIYSPSTVSAGESPSVVIYLHGGGWMFGSARGCEHVAVAICRAARVVVISVDYRLAPEHPFPASLDDCAHAIDWARNNAHRHGGDPGRVYLAGDSAGGNLAASSAVLQSKQGRHIQGVMLFYPVLNLARSESVSMRCFGKGYGLDADFLAKAIRLYVSDPLSRNRPEATPLNADPRLMPPALVIAAQFDILRDDAKLFADRIAAEGNRVRYLCVPGVTHAFLDSACCTVDFQRTVRETAEFIRRTSQPLR